MAKKSENTETVSLTYGQMAEGSMLFGFIEWMSKERIPLPTNDEVRSDVILRWLIHKQHEDFTALMDKLAKKKTRAKKVVR